MSYTNLSNIGVLPNQNYILNPRADHDTTGWATYADAASSRPVNGTGGSPTLTFTRVTTSPLTGVGSFLITKDAANRQGEGASYDFTIPASQQAQVLSIGMSYKVASGTFAMGSDSTDGDVIVYMYDVTNSALIEPISFKLDGSGLLTTIFQTAPNSTSYRLILHVASTSASAWTLKVDDVLVGPQAQAFKQPVTVARAYASSATTVGSGSATIIDFNTIDYDTSAGITTGGSWKYTATSSGFLRISSCVRLESISWTTGNQIEATVYKNGSADKDLYFAQAQATASYSVGLEGSVTVQCKAGDYFDLRIFQNSGGSANTGTGNQAVISIELISNSSLGSEGRVTAARASFNATRTVTTGAALEVIFDTKTSDTTNSFNSADGRFTAPASGFYRASYNLGLRVGSATGASYVTIRVNGSGGAQYGQFQNEVFPTSGGVYYPCVGTSLIYLNAGDFISIWAAQAITNSYSFEYGEFAIERISAPSQLPADAKVLLEYTGNAGTSITSSSDITFNTKVVDSHNAWSGTQFVAPIAGRYIFTGSVFVTAGSGSVLYSYVNGVQTRCLMSDAVTNSIKNFNGQVDLKAGDTLAIRKDGGSETLSNSTVYHHISICSQ